MALVSSTLLIKEIQIRLDGDSIVLPIRLLSICLQGPINYCLLGQLFVWSVAKNGFMFLKGCKQKKTKKHMQQRTYVDSKSKQPFLSPHLQKKLVPSWQTNRHIPSLQWKHKLET